MEGYRLLETKDFTRAIALVEEVVALATRGGWRNDELASPERLLRPSPVVATFTHVQPASQTSSVAAAIVAVQGSGPAVSSRGDEPSGPEFVPACYLGFTGRRELRTGRAPRRPGSRRGRYWLAQRRRWCGCSRRHCRCESAGGRRRNSRHRPGTRRWRQQV